MAKVFNVTGACIPEEHYMVNLDERLMKIKKLVDDGKYFTINRARQYGKTTTIYALRDYLRKDYYVVSLDFQTFSDSKFVDENTFSQAFAREFIRIFERYEQSERKLFMEAIASMKQSMKSTFDLPELFEQISAFCAISDKPLVLIIDEVDSATNNQVFLDFLAQLRAYYMNRKSEPAFRSVILAGVYDVKNLKRKLRPEDEMKVNSPWNIAADFDVDMSFSKQDIAGMLKKYDIQSR